MAYHCGMPRAQGLERFGVGKWAEISAELLPRWDDQALRIKATRLLGSQSLARYIGWKGTRCFMAGTGVGHKRTLGVQGRAPCSAETCAMRTACACLAHAHAA